jgi:hypothetical protein
MGAEASRSADHGHVKESIVQDVDTMFTDMLSKVLDLLVMDTSWPVDFWSRAVGPKGRHGAIQGDLIQQWSCGAQEIQ